MFLLQFRLIMPKLFHNQKLLQVRQKISDEFLWICQKYYNTHDICHVGMQIAQQAARFIICLDEISYLKKICVVLNAMQLFIYKNKEMQYNCQWDNYPLQITYLGCHRMSISKAHTVFSNMTCCVRFVNKLLLEIQ